MIQSGVQVHFRRVVYPRLFHVGESVAKVDAQEDGDADVGGQEGGGAPILGPEDVEAVNQAEEGEGRHRNVGAVRLDPRAVGQLGLDALDLTSFAEAEVDDAAADPRNEARGVGEVDLERDD